jgi:hypothetical protein
MQRAEQRAGEHKDDAHGINDEHHSPVSLNVILPCTTRSATRAAAAASRLDIVHHVLAATASKPKKFHGSRGED